MEDDVNKNQIEEIEDNEEVEEEEKVWTQKDVLKYVNRSKYRVRTVKAIGNKVKMPKEIAQDSGILQNHISNVLRQLKEKDVVECLNPDMRKGRLYRLSENGLDILDKIE